ncbi:O-antigen ligase family protein [Iningainema tapete]|uniref:O-antigen ligase family protein n=1 Tax=Iningainema tapete BLCC-T55 TaxID=2748662 RepID=A0A8J7C054_9CYAN|nr:O-antigen ligase family protein [Iningainema tapete]MBD2777378.1 O-antigen ligase family protein [Iningainema tapete BLCC-T55]
MNLYTTLMSLTLLLSGLTDILGRLSLGPISASGLLTVLLAVASWVLVLSRLRMPKIVLKTSFLVLFILFAILIWMWFNPTNTLPLVTSIQNLSVFVGFVGFILLSTTQSYRFDKVDYLSNNLTKAAQLSVVLYGLSLLVSGPGASTLMGARSFALFAIIGLSWFLAMWRYRLNGGLFWATCTIVAIAFSYSRTATLIGVILFPFSQISLTTVKGWIRMILTIFLIVVVAFLAFNYVGPIRDRFTAVGDNAKVGGLQINTAGRNIAWTIAYESGLQSPWIGKGPGSVSITLVKTVGSAFVHPHNDYLRIFHDYGLIGFTLWLCGYWGLITQSWQNWQWADRHDRSNAHIHLATLLALVAVAFAMTSDNIVVYIFAMNPLGILVGASFGSASRRKKEIKSAQNFTQVSGLGNLAT